MNEAKEMKLHLAGAPALLIFQETPEKAGRKGTILFYHGLRADKETHYKELRSLANAGFLAIGIDAIGHGERMYPECRDINPAQDFEKVFMQMVAGTVDEIPRIIDELVDRGYSTSDRIGIGGISMGGFITYRALIVEPRLKAACPVLGSPAWKACPGLSPDGFPDRFYPTALLAQNAGKDVNVPAYWSRKFCKKLRNFYKDSPERLRYVEYAESGHFMREEDWNILWKNVVDWFERFIAE